MENHFSSSTFNTFYFKRPSSSLPSSSPSSPIDSFWNLPSPPSELFVQGKAEALSILDQLPERGLAIVGTRTPHPRSLAFLESAIHKLAGSDLVIVSGLARGIDAAAHRFALQAGLKTVALLGTGLDSHYPEETLSVRHQIISEGGLVMSEFPPRHRTRKYHFLQRNRLIAGFAKATWVVEAGLRSGALNTAKWTRELNRPCLATPCFPSDPQWGGNQVLLDRDHALPFWDIQSLGAVWIELVSHSARQAKNQDKHSLLNNDPLLNSLFTELQQRTVEGGGASQFDLFNWALTHRWTSEDFFRTLQIALRQNLVVDQQGTLIIHSQY